MDVFDKLWFLYFIYSSHFIAGGGVGVPSIPLQFC